MNHRFSLGIDLGTSNSAIALTDLESDRTAIVEVTQILGPGKVGEKPTLPSALYIPHRDEFPADAFPLPWRDDAGETTIIGTFARDHGALVPDRLITSAKSWLSNPHIDPRQQVLPWKSDIDEAKLSAFDCSRGYLEHLKDGFLHAELTRLDAQIKDIATLRAEIEALKARQKAVEDLQTDRNVPVHLLNELVRQTPEGVYLTTIKQNAQVVAVNGVAQTNERVSEFLRNALYNSPWLEKPELVEIKAVALTTANREQRRLFEFSMRLTLKRPQAAAAAASGAASQPAAAGKRS